MMISLKIHSAGIKKSMKQNTLEKMDDTELEVDSTEQDKGHDHAAH